MTVSLEYDPDSGPQGGISRLRRLASFGRYGADVHASARTACSQVSGERRQHRAKECSLLAASLSSFYGWVAKQTGSKAVLGEKSSRREQKLHVTKQAVTMAKAVVEASPLAVPMQRPCKTASRPVKLQQQVQLPSIFTMQGVSANTSCFNSLSYKTADNRRIHGLVQSSKHVEAASLYLEDTAAVPKNRQRMSRQARSTSLPSVPRPCKHAAAGSTPVKFDAKPATKASCHGPCNEYRCRPHHVSPDPCLLLDPQSDGTKPVAAPSQVPQLDLQHLMPPAKMHQAFQQEGHHAQHAQQERHHAHQELREAQRAQQECPKTPQTGRSSQSDATHHDHHDSYRSDSKCCDASQLAQADLPQAPALHQLPAVDAAWLGGDSNASQHDSMESCQCGASSQPQRPLDKVLGLEDGLHHKAISVMGQASPEVVNSDRLIGRQGVPAKRARPAPQRALVNITNTAKIAVRKRQVAHLVKDVGGCTAASVPDLVTFWEQRACVQEC